MSEFDYHQRASKDYASGWDRIFGKKESDSPCKHNTMFYSDPMQCADCGYIFSEEWPVALAPEPANQPPYTVLQWPELDMSSAEPTEDEKLLKKLAYGLIEQAEALGLNVEIWRDTIDSVTKYWVEVWPNPATE